MTVKEKVENGIFKIAGKIMNALSQEESARLNSEKIITEGMAEVLRAAAAEGAVLLENKVLPFKEGSKVSIFGRNQIDYFYTGYGSGGDVNAPYKISLLDGMKNCEKLKVNEPLAEIYEKWVKKNPVEHGIWGHWPRYYPEMPAVDSVIEDAAKNSDYAVVVIGHSSGEDRENVLEKGSYYLTDEETGLLNKVTKYFENTVVLMNIGSIIDMSWVKKYKDRLGAVMIVWQGGMESGNAVADVLSGKVTPSGRLTDTIAEKYEDYPSADFGGKKFNDYTEDIYVGYRWFETFHRDKVLYPFGYGLSYTKFSSEFKNIDETQDGYDITVKVTNSGDTYSGKETVLLYIEKPCGVLGNPSRELVAFGKTGLLAPGESENVELHFLKKQFSSYDDSGRTGNKSCYVTEKGLYRLYLGGDVRSAEKVWECSIENDIVTEKLTEASAPKYAFDVAGASEDSNGVRTVKKMPVHTSTTNLRQIIFDNMPKDLPITGDKGYKLADVKSGKVSMDDFVAQLSLDELEGIARGDFTMHSPLGTKGNTGVYGGVLQSLRDKGVLPVTATDGPSGIRLFATCSLMPIGTLLACTYDTKLLNSLFEKIGLEMKDRGSDVLLGPGMNIHRNPLCGRNFEYFSEDPFVAGTIAAAEVTGLQKTGVSACPKHFACNNQEYNRNKNDSRLSERALREIYLKGFEICVKMAKPRNLMTSYNKINGVWGHYNYELCTTVLRNEWGYKGCVMTDWWMQSSKSPEFPNIRNNAYRVRAQVDVLMPGGKRVGKNQKPDGTLLESYGKPNGITLGEMQRSAKNVLNFVMNSSRFGS